MSALRIKVCRDTFQTDLFFVDSLPCFFLLFLPQCSHFVLSNHSKLPSFVPQAFKHSILRCWHDANHFLVVSTCLYTALEYCGSMQGIPYICYSELYVFTDIYKNFTFHDMSSRVLLRGLNTFRRAKSLLSITENA